MQLVYYLLAFARDDFVDTKYVCVLVFMFHFDVVAIEWDFMRQLSDCLYPPNDVILKGESVAKHLQQRLQMSVNRNHYHFVIIFIRF